VSLCVVHRSRSSCRLGCAAGCAALDARVVFFGGVAAMALAGGHGRPPAVSFVHCYRLAWSSYVDVEAARGCGSQASLRRRERWISCLEVWHSLISLQMACSSRPKSRTERQT